MKINKINTYKNKLLQLKLVNTKIYKKNQNNFVKIEDIANRLKKAFNVIYRFHTNNKRILFVGSPVNLSADLKGLIKKTKHILIPGSIWMNGILTNQKSCFKYLSKNQKVINNKISETLFKLKRRSDLIVILDSLANNSALNEGYLTRTPVISFNTELQISEYKSSYKIPGNFRFCEKKIRDTFFYSILAATLKKASKNCKKKTKPKKAHLYKRNKSFRTKKKFFSHQILT